MKKLNRSITSILAGSLISLSVSASADDARPVTQDQFKDTLRVLKRMVDRIDRLEKQGPGNKSSAAKGNTDVVDLNDLSSTSTPAAASGKGMHGGSAGGGGNFKVFFDWNLINRPGITPLSFANYHALFFYEILPTPDLQFAADISSSPRFYELDYQISPKLQVRVGKIWIPFDDMSPHNIFGGRVNVSRLSVNGAHFLPDIWADLGIGLKYQLLDTRALALDAHLYVVNGFGSGGQDPSGGANSYPNFGDSTVGSLDNNRNKAIGTRVHALMGGTIGVGASYYTGRWNDDAETLAQNVSILGLDAQFRFKSAEIRTGLASMNVGILPDAQNRTSFTRGGMYGEFGQKFGAQKQWKFLARGGTIQLDDRVIDVTDQTIVGGTILYKPSLIEYSLEHSRDIKADPGKINHSYTAFRIVIAL